MRRSKSAARAPCRCAARCPDLADGMGALDPAAIAQVAAESWPVVRDADELHDALLTLITLPPAARVAAVVRRTGRGASRHRDPGWRRHFWVAAERAGMARVGALRHRRRAADRRHRNPARLARIHRTRDGAGTRRTAGSAAATWSMPRLARLEAEGQILRGQFSPMRIRPKSSGATAACWRAFTA